MAVLVDPDEGGLLVVDDDLLLVLGVVDDDDVAGSGPDDLLGLRGAASSAVWGEASFGYQTPVQTGVLMSPATNST